MVSLPPWLPSPIAAQATRLLNSGALDLDKEARARLIRLISDPEMQKVWTTLSQAPSNETALVDFLDLVRLHPTVQGPWLQAPALSAAQQRKSLARMARLANMLLEELGHLGGRANVPESGLSVLESALRRAEMELLRARRSSEPVVMLSLPAIADEDEDQPSPIQVLAALARSAELATGAPPPPGPRKQKAQNALRTAYIQDISAFVQHRFGKPFPTAVAITISVSLNDVELNEDLVRKISRPKRKIPSKKAP